MKKIHELTEEDVHIPSLNSESWDRFLHTTGLKKIWRNDHNSYQGALSKYAIEHGFELLVIDASMEYGYVFRFKHKSEKLAFLLKWA